MWTPEAVNIKSCFGISRSPLTLASRVTQDEPFTWQKDSPPRRVPGQVDRVPWEGGLPCPAYKRFNAFSKEMYAKLALPG